MKFFNIDIRYKKSFSLSLLEKILLLINLLLPIALVTGPFLSDLIIVISSLIFIFFSIFEKKFFFYKNIHFYLFIFICTFFLFSSINSKDIIFSLESSLFYFRFGFFVLSLWYILLYYENFSYIMFYSLMITILILSIDAIIQFNYGYNIIGNRYDGHRLSGFFGEELKLGSYISRLLPIVIALFIVNFSKFSKKSIVIFLTTVFFSFVVVLLSGERVSTAYLLFIFFSILLISFKNLRLFIFISLSLIMFLLIFISNDKMFNSFMYRNVVSTIEQSNLINFNDLKENEVNKINEFEFKQGEVENNINLISNYANILLKNSKEYTFTNLYEKILNNEINVFTHSYHNIYKTALLISKDNLLIGIGPKLFRQECKKIKYYDNSVSPYKYAGNNSWDPSLYGCSTHPHNIHLQILTETGIFGLIFILFVFIIVFIRITYNLLLYYYNNNYLRSYKFFLYLAIFITLFPIQPTGSFFNNWNSIIFYLPVGFILKEIYYENVKNNLIK